MKTFYLTLSKVFPSTHARAGSPTGFKQKFLAAVSGAKDEWLKLHTIRANCEYCKNASSRLRRAKPASPSATSSTSPAMPTEAKSSANLQGHTARKTDTPSVGCCGRQRSKQNVGIFPTPVADRN